MYIYRRHLSSCRHEGRLKQRCRCPFWVDGQRGGRRIHQSLRTTKEDTALSRLRALELQGSPSRTIVSAQTAWEAHLVTQGVKDSTLTKYRRLMHQFAAWGSAHEITAINQIGLEELDGFRASRSKIAKSTSVKELQCLRGFFSFCLTRRWIDENPAKSIPTPKIPPNEVVPYTSEQIGAILAACQEVGQQEYERSRARAMILVMRYTGLRISDVMMLQKSQVRNGVLALYTKKTTGQVMVPIPPELDQVLKDLPLPIGTGKPTGYFFWNGKSDYHALVQGEASRLLAAVFRKSGVPNAHAHRFRHTLATDLLGRGATEQDVADILGVSPAIVRKHYGKWSKARQNRIFDLMREYQKGS